MKEPTLSEVIKFIQQMNTNHAISNYRLGMDIPNECRAVCKATKSKCCEKINRENRLQSYYL